MLISEQVRQALASGVARENLAQHLGLSVPQVRGGIGYLRKQGLLPLFVARQDVVLLALQAGLTRPQIAAQMKVSRRVVNHAIADLRRQGKIAADEYVAPREPRRPKRFSRRALEINNARALMDLGADLNEIANGLSVPRYRARQIANAARKAICD